MFCAFVCVSVRKTGLRCEGWRAIVFMDSCFLRVFFLNSCLLEAFTLATIDGYSKHYEKYQFTLIMDLPVVLEVRCIQGVMQAHRLLKSPIKN